MLPSNTALIPPRLRYSIPWSQILDTFCPERKAALRSTLRNLRCSKISIGRLSAEDLGVLSKPGGTMSLSARVSVPRAVLRSSSTSIGPYKSSQLTILRCSHTKGWKIRRDGAQFTWSATGPDLYLVRRVYSILGIRPRHTGLPGQAFCTACWDHCSQHLIRCFYCDSGTRRKPVPNTCLFHPVSILFESDLCSIFDACLHLPTSSVVSIAMVYFKLYFPATIHDFIS
jgi:hypothetical protein